MHNLLKNINGNFNENHKTSVSAQKSLHTNKYIAANIKIYTSTDMFTVGESIATSSMLTHIHIKVIVILILPASHGNH